MSPYYAEFKSALYGLIDPAFEDYFAADRAMTIGEMALWEKTGGRSGTYRRPEPT